VVLQLLQLIDFCDLFFIFNPSALSEFQSSCRFFGLFVRFLQFFSFVKFDQSKVVARGQSTMSQTLA